MSGSIHFAFVIHNHQPLGNLPWNFEDAFRTAYLPFLQCVERHPGIRVGIHNTGILLDWYERHHPEYLQLLRQLVDRGQVEILGGAYYEPILPSIPAIDQVGQIRRLRQSCAARFGEPPAGAWIAERVWEPSLPVSLAAAGVEYVVLDDSHFAAVGIEADDLFGYYRTESGGFPIAVVPIHQQVRQSIPFELPEKTLKILQEACTPAGDRLILFADDGEKLGDWPGTHQWVYTEGYLDRLFSLLEGASWLKSTLLMDYLDGAPPLGMVYLPTAAYAEMQEWSGGYWPNFLRRYPESNWMHKRSLQISRRLQIAADLPDSIRQEAREEVYRSQCNCPYWHGVFGGLYLPHLRRETFSHVIQAEALLDRCIPAQDTLERTAEPDASSVGTTPGPLVSREDILLLGEPQVRIATSSLVLYLDPSTGGHLLEMDSRPHRLNLLATLARRAESYHEELETPNTVIWGLDWHGRGSLIDHFFGPTANLAGFAHSDFPEQGDFVLGRYHAEIDPGSRARVTFSRVGGVWESGEFAPLRVSKALTIQDASVVRVEYEIESLASRPLTLHFGVEFGFGLTSGDSPDRYYRIDGEKPQDARLSSLAETRAAAVDLVDEWAGLSISLQAEAPLDIWRLPLYSLSRSESVLESVWQGSVVVLHCRLGLAPGGSWRLPLLLSVNSL